MVIFINDRTVCEEVRRLDKIKRVISAIDDVISFVMGENLPLKDTVIIERYPNLMP